MIFPDERDWEEWGVTSEIHKFFILRWQEIFDEETLDTWQVRFSNIRSILDEILNCLEVVSTVHKYHHNILCLLLEAKTIIANDEVVKKHYPFVGEYLSRLESEYNAKIKNENAVDVKSFKKVVMVLIGNISGYQNYLFIMLRKIISSTEPHYKDQLNSLTTLLGTELTNLGYSIHSLRDSFKILTDSGAGNFENRFDKLRDTFSGADRKYICYFHTSWPQDLLDLPDSGMKLISDRSLASSAEESRFYSYDPQSVIASIEVTALDCYSARYLAETKLDELFSVSKLYIISKKIIIRSEIALVVDDRGIGICISQDNSRLGYIKDSRQALESVASYYKLSNRLIESDRRRLLAALQYHKLALMAQTDEIRLINMWIALESLVRDDGKPIIENMCACVPVSITTNYIYRIMKSLPIDVRSVLRGGDSQELLALLPGASRYLLKPKDMLLILLDEEEGATINAFYKMITGNVLMCYRTYCLRKWLSSGPKSVYHKLECHKQNIEWQLKRIYRARNRIMHQGICPRGSRQLIQNLHSYFIITFHNLIHDLLKKDIFGVSDAFEHRKLAYSYYVNRLRSDRTDQLSVKQILSVDLALCNFFDTPAWGRH